MQLNPFLCGRPPYEGFRKFVEERFENAGRHFTSFALDVGQGAVLSGEAEWKDWPADLSFVSIERPRLPVYPLAERVAEKLHEYTRPREHRTRAKDLLDLAGPGSGLIAASPTPMPRGST